MKNFKRAIAVFFACMLSLFAFCGCGKKNNDNNSQSPNSTIEQPENVNSAKYKVDMEKIALSNQKVKLFVCMDDIILDKKCD